MHRRSFLQGVGISTFVAPTRAFLAPALARDQPAWPTGADGSLVVYPGKPYEIPAGKICDFASVTIETGAVLKIGFGSAWTMIGCKGDFILKGVIAANLADYSEEAAINLSAPDGYSHSQPVHQPSGGNGGPNTGTSTFPSGPGQSDSGNGGGGAPPYGYGGHASRDSGGDGGRCRLGGARDCAGGGNGGRISGSTENGKGGNGGNGGDAHNAAGAEGGGGGGGARGLHGGFVYLRVLGDFYGGEGVIDVSGNDGGSGGKGGDAYQVSGWREDACGGSGGGGGAGGNGGFVIGRISGKHELPFTKANAGRGGSGGGRGQNIITTPGSAPGSAGNDGSNASGGADGAIVFTT